MAALPLFKLLCKTCSGSVNPALYIPAIRLLSAERDSIQNSIESRKFSDRPKRSYSTPSRSSVNKISKKGKEQCLQIRKISRSVENLKNYKRNENKDIPAFRYSKPVDEIQDDDPVEEPLSNEIDPEPEPPKPEINFESNVRYELSSTKSTAENFSDVMEYMMDYELKKPMKIFPHLQPINIKPYGSNETMMFPLSPKRPVRIVYPPNSFISGSPDGNQPEMEVIEEPEMPEPTSIDKGFERNLNSYVQEKEYPGYEDAKKMVVCETPSKTQQNLSRKNYSTTAVHVPSSDKPKVPPTIANFVFTKPALRHPLLKEIKSSVIKKKLIAKEKPAAANLPARRYKIGELLINSALKPDSPNIANKSIMEKAKMNAFYGNWPVIDLKNEAHFDKKSPVQSKCGGVERPQTVAKKTQSHSKSSTKVTYSTGLLSRSRQTLSIQNSNRKTFASTAHKDDTPPEDCCKEYVTVKLGELQEECIKAGKCKPPKPKTGRLPKYVPADCPCKENPPLKVGKPLAPLKKRYEPKAQPWACEQLKACIQPRADDNYTLQEKRLPKLSAPACCPITESKWKDLKIRRLPKRKIIDPPRISPQPEVPEEQVRADDCLESKTEPKKLPALKPQNCPRSDNHRPPPGKPLTRLKPRPFCEKPNIFKEEITYNIVRADDGLVLKPKKLAVHKPQNSPSPEPIEMPPVPLKRIKWSPIPEPLRVQPPAVEEDHCILKRADDDLTLTPRKLPLLKPSICPCFDEPPPQPGKPLPRLKFKPVYEKPKISPKCEHSISRADEGLVVKPKKLPTYKAQDIPCPDNRPLPVKPLARRARIKFKPVVEERKVCLPDVVVSESPRADEGRVMLPKKLPVHKAPRSPCPESCPPPEKPLPRLKAKPIQDPPKCDPKPTYEERIVRADEGLTVLPKLLPVLKATTCPPSVEPLNATAPKLARIKFKPIQEPERHHPVPEATCKIVERADEHDWIYWRKLDVGKKDTCQKPEPCIETSLIVRPEDCLKDNTWMTPVSYDEMTDKRSVSCGMLKRGYSTSCCHHDTSSINMRLFKAEDIFDIKPPLNKLKPVDKVGILVCNNSTMNSAHAKDSLPRTQSRNSGVNAPVFNNFNTVSRFVSTYNNLQQRVPPPTPPSLQPKKKMITQREQFIDLFPCDEMIENARSKGRDFAPPDKTKEDHQEDKPAMQERLCCDDEDECRERKGKDKYEDPCDMETLTLWQRIVNFFKAKDCPSPEEFRKMRLREDAERAAAKAGLCLYDPLECKSNGEKLPKVQTADCDDEDDKKQSKQNNC